MDVRERINIAIEEIKDYRRKRNPLDFEFVVLISLEAILHYLCKKSR